ncbi:MAG: hypothetical protein J6X02_02045 [Bacilli bacterium]|nr:hypothetical protein [Bacilli bacterium]
MRNYRMYLPGFREMKEYLETDEDYSLNVRLYMKSEYHEHGDYIIPIEREEKQRRIFPRKKSIKEKFVTVRNNSDASSYFRAEYRGNRISEDYYGNLIVPFSYMDDKPKTR